MHTDYQAGTMPIIQWYNQRYYRTEPPPREPEAIEWNADVWAERRDYRWKNVKMQLRNNWRRPREGGSPHSSMN
jgi:hypothetical protein